MNGNELLRKLKRLAKDNGLELRYDKAHGKGSHGTIYFGSKRTTLKDPKKEIGAGLLGKILEQLGIDKDEL